MPGRRSHALLGVVARAALCACVLGLLLVAVAGTAGAAADRRTMRLDALPVSIEFAVADQRVADRVASICETSVPRLAGELGLESVAPFRVALVSDVRASDVGARLPEWGVAFAFMSQQVMLVDVERATSAWNELEKIIPHEISHLLLAQKIGSVEMPRWFVEGLAMWQAREWSLFDHWRLMEAVWGRRAPSLAGIDATLPADESRARDAYLVSYAGITSRFGDAPERLPDFLGVLAEAGDFAAAFDTFWGESEQDFYARFDAALAHKYSSRLLLFQVGPLFSIIAVLFLFVFLKVHLRSRRKLARLERAERDASVEERGRFR